jgi:hypothetical protein
MQCAEKLCDSTLLAIMCMATKKKAQSFGLAMMWTEPSLQAGRVAGMESNPDVELERIIYERDLQRTQWLIKVYHRTRIHKIEQHVQYYLHHAEYTSRMSAAELEYAKAYFTAVGRSVSGSSI